MIWYRSWRHLPELPSCAVLSSVTAIWHWLNTRYVFAGIPEELDLRDIDGIRKWFIASLTGMGNLLDLITESPALTGTTE